jgi:hypothetical protein
MPIGSYARRRLASQQDSNVIFDVKPILKSMNQLEPGFKNRMIKDMKVITKPAVTEIKSVVPKTSPLSGMSNSRVPRYDGGLNSTDGRLNWESGVWKGKRIAPDNVIPRFSASRSLRTNVTSLFAIWLRSPGPAMLSTAGRGSGISRSPRTREYPYKGGMRRHRNNGQGQVLIRRVRELGLYNFFYKAGDKRRRDMEREVRLVWDKYTTDFNKKWG